MRRSKWEEGYLLIDALVAILILALALSALSGLYARQVRAMERKTEETATYLSARTGFTGELEYEY